MSVLRSFATRVGPAARNWRRGGGSLPKSLYDKSAQAKQVNQDYQDRQDSIRMKNLLLGGFLTFSAFCIYKYSIWAVREGADTLEARKEFENIERELDEEEMAKKRDATRREGNKQ
eukprot:g17211.t1